MEISEIVTLIPIIISILAVLHTVGNSILNISIHEKIENVKGFVASEINVTLIVVLIMYLAGLFIGYLIKYTNIYLLTMPVIVLSILSILMREKSSLKFLNKSYKSQIVVYYLVPLIVGVIEGGTVDSLFNNLSKSPSTAASQISILILGLLALLIFVGRYRAKNFMKNTKIKIVLNDLSLTGILISETSHEIFVDVNSKIHRISKSEVKYIKEI